jgi:hypothetical protein
MAKFTIGRSSDIYHFEAMDLWVITQLTFFFAGFGPDMKQTVRAKCAIVTLPVGVDGEAG